MRLTLLFFLCVGLTTTLRAQTVIFSDDFDSGLSQWTLSGTWGTDNSTSFNGLNSLADSPGGDYGNNVNSTATMASNVNFNGALDASCGFKVKYDIENGFDTCYVDVSTNGGTSWTNVHYFNGENNLTTWQNVNISLGGFVGSSQVRLRFRMFTDGGYIADGIFIDSFRIDTSMVDNSPPFLIHNPDPHYEGQLDTNYRTATIQDASGLASATLSYMIDGGPAINVITAYDTNNNDYSYAIPPQSAGSFVKYWIDAVDNSAQSNAIQSDTFEYIAGNYIKHDNAIVTFIQNFGPGSGTGNNGIANRMSLPGNTTITSALIRNYTDINNPNDSIEVHIWSNNGGNPGTDLITPITVFPSASINFPNIMTVLDLRPYSSLLDSLQGDVFIGYTVPSGNAWTTITAVGGGNGRGRYFDGTSWSNALGTYTYHFRLVTGPSSFGPTANFAFDNSNDPIIAFTDSSSANTNTLHWDFNGEDTSTVANPTYTFTTPGFKTVCLTASNFVGTDQHCENILITNSKPKAEFSFSNANDPTIDFTDESLYNPDTWFWDFGDGNFASSQNPSHTYQTADTFNVCLYVSNNFGADTFCNNVIVSNALPVSLFGHTILSGNKVFFNDLSSESPNAWQWYFDDLDSSTVQNPNYDFPEDGGEFEVCLTASNQFGSGTTFCDTIEVPDITSVAELSKLGINVGPNPASDWLNISGNDLNQFHFRLFNLEGKRISFNQIDNGEWRKLNVSGLENGIYILEIETSTELLRTPIVINH